LATWPPWLRRSTVGRDAQLCPRLATANPFRGGLELCATIALAAFLFCGAVRLLAQNEPVLVPDVVDYKKLIPILPDAPTGWTAETPEGSNEEVGGFKITNVHRDYHKGEGADAPTASISILDSVANPDYVTATTAAWNETSSTAEGYSKSVTIDGNPGFEAVENNVTPFSELKKLEEERGKLQNASPKDEAALRDLDKKIEEAIKGLHASLWVMVAKRYFVEIELQKQDAKELQEWVKRVDLKKLAEIK
jgi:hypothetical protein